MTTEEKKTIHTIPNRKMHYAGIMRVLFCIQPLFILGLFVCHKSMTSRLENKHMIF